MSKPGEINYPKQIDPATLTYAMEKPFSDPSCWRYLQEVGTMMSLLPRPPARLLDLGCGTGWTSRLFGKCGYDVVGVDIAPAMISAAEEMNRRDHVEKVRFMVADYEDLNFKEEFDTAVFFDALHHAEDERLALQKTYQALRTGGVLVCSEPGEGHSLSEAAIDAVKRFGVTEKDMPPRHIMELGRQIGFREFACYPFAWMNRVYAPENPQLLADPLKRPNRLKRMVVSLGRRIMGMSAEELRTFLIYRRHILTLNGTAIVGGITRMVK